MKVKLEIHIPPKWQAVLEVLRFHHAVVLSIFSALIPTLDFPGFAPAKVPALLMVLVLWMTSLETDIPSLI